MAIERQYEIPGFQWRHFNDLGIYVPAPPQWEFTRVRMGEAILISGYDTTTGDRGNFDTQVAIGALEAKEDQDLEEKAERNKTNLLALREMDPNLEITVNAPLIVARGTYHKKEGFLKLNVGQNLKEIIYSPQSLCYFARAFNANTGTEYAACFQTPLGDRRRAIVGQTMVRNLFFDRNV